MRKASFGVVWVGVEDRFKGENQQKLNKKHAERRVSTPIFSGSAFFWLTISAAEILEHAS